MLQRVSMKRYFGEGKSLHRDAWGCYHMIMAMAKRSTGLYRVIGIIRPCRAG